MKRIIITLGLAVMALTAYASEELDIYTMLYKDATSAAERFAVLRNVAESNLSGAGSLYAEALTRLLQEQPTFKTTAEKETADSSARLLSKLLGEAGYAASAGDLWKTVQSFSNPLVKADALIAIGRTRSPAQRDLVVKLLSDLNLNPTDDRDAGEKTAYGAILALEKYRDSAGYLPVFFASNGWYSRRVKDQAAATLPLIMDDPSEPLASVIQSSSYEVKLLALQKENESKASPKGKSEVALVALTEGWKAATNDVKDRVRLGSLRKLSIEMIARNGVASDAATPLLERSYKEGIDMEERLGAVQALAAVNTDGAARSLSSFLMILNGKRKSGNITQDDERLVRAVIPALGSTGKPLARPALKTVENLEWPNAVKVLAAEALKKIQ
jgi:hypothetical protein